MPAPVPEGLAAQPAGTGSAARGEHPAAARDQRRGGRRRPRRRGRTGPRRRGRTGPRRRGPPDSGRGGGGGGGGRRRAARRGGRRRARGRRGRRRAGRRRGRRRAARRRGRRRAARRRRRRRAARRRRRRRAACRRGRRRAARRRGRRRAARRRGRRRAARRRRRRLAACRRGRRRAARRRRRRLAACRRGRRRAAGRRGRRRGGRCRVGAGAVTHAVAAGGEVEAVLAGPRVAAVVGAGVAVVAVGRHPRRLARVVHARLDAGGAEVLGAVAVAGAAARDRGVHAPRHRVAGVHDAGRVGVTVDRVVHAPRHRVAAVGRAGVMVVAVERRPRLAHAGASVARPAGVADRAAVRILLAAAADTDVVAVVGHLVARVGGADIAIVATDRRPLLAHPGGVVAGHSAVAERPAGAGVGVRAGVLRRVTGIVRAVDAVVAVGVEVAAAGDRREGAGAGHVVARVGGADVVVLADHRRSGLALTGRLTDHYVAGLAAVAGIPVVAVGVRGAAMGDRRMYAAARPAVGRRIAAVRGAVVVIVAGGGLVGVRAGGRARAAVADVVGAHVAVVAAGRPRRPDGVGGTARTRGRERDELADLGCMSGRCLRAGRAGGCL